MRALVVYESMYGNTHVIASSIAGGLRADCEVTLVPVAEATRDLFAAADLLVDPDAGGRGMRDWLRDLGHRNDLAATFDTRLDGVPAFTGRAGRPIARLLKRHGYRLVAAPESFLVGSQNMLLDGEAARARRWGMTLGAVSKTYLPALA
jgi:hypothetical protein